MSIRRKLICILVVVGLLFGNIAYTDEIFLDIFGHWAEENILWSSGNDLFTGYEDGTFKPDKEITRAEYMTILYRAASKKDFFKENKDSNYLSKLSYKNIDNKSWWYKNVNNIAEYTDKHSSKGKFTKILGKNNLLPNNSINRREAALLTSSFISFPTVTEEVYFTDVSSYDPDYEEIKKLVANGIITGYGDGSLKLQNKITRAEAATIIKRIFIDMDFRYKMNSYLPGITIEESPDDNQFMFFGDYEARKNEKNLYSEEDIKYTEAKITLEYKSIVGRIPEWEMHNYDKNPLGTIIKLGKENYWNKIGINYYLIQNLNLNKENKMNYIKEILNEYLKRDDLSFLESKQIFNLAIKNDFENEELLLKGLDSWMTKTKENQEKAIIVSMKAKVLSDKKRYKEALSVYNKLETPKNVDILKNYHFNKAYIMISLKRYKEAEAEIDKYWRSIESNKTYKALKSRIDDGLERMPKVQDRSKYGDFSYLDSLYYWNYISKLDYDKYKAYMRKYEEVLGAKKKILYLKNN